MTSFFNFQDIFSGSPEGQQRRIRFFVLLSTALGALQLVLVTVRRSVRVKYIYTQIIYACTPVAITTTISLMHNASTVDPRNPIYACGLAGMYGAIAAMSPCNIGDNERSTLYMLASISPLFFWAVWLASIAIYDCTPLQTCALVITVVVCAIVGLLEMMSAMCAFYLTSKSKGLPGFVEPIVRHMRESRDVPDADSANPTSMIGYLVWHDPAQPDNIITTADIWGSVGISYLRDCRAVELLKDMCLSYAFFKVILTRFADYPLHQRSDPKTRRFVREGLLFNSRESAERLFCIIELELNFLFELFYTMKCAHSLYNFKSSAIRFLSFVYVQSWIFTACVFIEIYTKNFAILHLAYVVLLFAMGMYSDRQACSKWRLVGHLCTGLSKFGKDGVGARKLENLVAKQWAWRESDSRLFNPLGILCPWQRKLGQYSFLESYGQVPFFSRPFFSPFSKLVRLPRVGQAGDFNVPLSDLVKQQMVKSLLRHVQDVAVPLSRGTATIASQKNFTDPCGLENKTDAQVILVWHIATTICESLPAHRPHNANDFLVTTQLSKYCAYLLAFAPELLPDHPHNTERFFDRAVQQAQHIIIQGRNVGDQYQEWIGVEVAPAPNFNGSIIAQGAQLAQALIDQVMVLEGPDHGWRFLAEFWAELLLYLAPSDNVLAHGEYLARGGEFITHIWALLTHAGIVTRRNVREDSSTSRSQPVRVRRRLRSKSV